MALLDTLRKIPKAIGRNLEKNIGGLLGESLENLSDDERKAIRRQAAMAVFDAMARGTTPAAGLERVAAMTGARLEQRAAKKRQAEAEAMLPDISSRILGGRTGTMIEDVGGGPATPLTARRAPSEAGAREALGMMYGTQAGRDVAAGMPELAKLAQEGMTGRTVGGAVYNPLTGQFTRPPSEQVKTLTAKEVADMGLPRGTIVQRSPSGEIKVVREPQAAGIGGTPTLRQVRLPSGLVQDEWLIPGQARGVPVGAPYAPKGGEGAGDGLNERQRAGVNMTREAALQYAANLTGLSVSALGKLSPAEIEQKIKERGGRVLQGGLARTAGSLPIVGDFARSIVDAANADLIAPATTGGSGIAMYQNPTGPITGADVTVGVTQFPNPTYPLPVQAQMIRSILERGGKVEEYDANGNKVR